MAKPTITKRSVKGAALTYAELDTNFDNLRDATLTLKAGTGGVAVTADLNGTITLVAGTNVTLTGDDGAKTITIDSTGGGGSLDVDLISVGEADSDAVTIQAQTSQDKAIILKAAYPSAPSLASYIKIGAPGDIELRSSGVIIGNATGNSALTFTDTSWNVSGVLVKSSSSTQIQNNSSNNTNLQLTSTQIAVKGPFVIDSFTTTERNALTATNGMLIYNTTDSKVQAYANGSWVNLH